MLKAIECKPQQQSRTPILKLHYWNLPWSWLRCREYIGSDWGKDQLTFCCLLWFRNQVFPEIIKFDVNSTQQSTCWGTSEGGDYPPYRLSVDFNFQVTSSRKCRIGWICRTACTIKAHLTIHFGPASNSVQSFCCYWIYAWEFEGDHLPDESTWWRGVAKIDHQAVQWILKWMQINHW